MLLATAATGAIIGFAPLQQIAASMVGRAGIGNLVAVNLLLPLASIAGAVVFPRYRTAIGGGLLVVVGFTVARLLLAQPRFWSWSVPFVAAQVSPILVAAAFGCMVFGAVAAALTQTVRRAGSPPPLYATCVHCGYELLGPHGQQQASARCPECGEILISSSTSYTRDDADRSSRN